MRRTAAGLVVVAWATCTAVAPAQPGGAEANESQAETVRGPLGLPAAPLTEPLVTDRPDFTESTEAVPFGRVQLEMGYTFTWDHEDGERVKNHTAPEGLLRLGLWEDFELRIGWEGYSWSQERFGDESPRGRPITRREWSQGANDLSLGFKYKLVEQDGLVPHFGVIGELSLPSGSAGVSSGDVDPGVKLLWAYDLTDDLAIAGNINFAVPTEEAGRFFQTAASLTLAYSLTDRVGTYVEYYGFYPNTRSSDCAHFVNGGFTYLLTDNLQFDIRAGVGLNEEADDFFSGIGFSWRF